jgi:hypothetical protein
MPGVASGAILFDNASSSTTSGNSTLTFNHTIGGGSDRLLVVCIAVEEDTPDADVSTVTYDGVAMTKAVDHAVGSAADMNVEMWYMLEANLPAVGTYSVFIDCPNLAGSSNIDGGAISVTGAAQQAPEVTAFTDDGDSGASSIQTSITTLTNEAWIFECVGSGDPHTGFTAETGQTERFDVLGGSSRLAAGTEEKATAGLETQQWTTDSSSNRLSYVLAAFAPSGGGGGGGAAPGVVNYRSIGTDSGLLHSDGDATISSGTSTVAFGGTANIPTNVGTGDKLVIFGGGIVREQFRVGGSNSTPELLPLIDGGTDQSYVLFIATRSNRDVTSVTGGGMTWTERLEQCGDDNEMGQRIWTAQGSPGSSFQVQIDWVSGGGANLAAILLRYSGVGAFEDPTGENINGEFGGCADASDTDTAQLTLSSTADGSVHVVGVAPRDATVSSYSSGYSNITVKVVGSGMNETREALYERTFDPAATDMFQATLSDNEDWVTGGIVLSPARKYYVLTRDSSTQVTIQGTAATDHTNDVYEIRRAYNTMQDWEDDREGGSPWPRIKGTPGRRIPALASAPPGPTTTGIPATRLPWRTSTPGSSGWRSRASATRATRYISPTAPPGPTAACRTSTCTRSGRATPTPGSRSTRSALRSAIAS